MTKKKGGQQCTVDGFEFTLSEGSNVIYVFKGDALVTTHSCLNTKEAEKMFEEIKTKKKVVFR